jgi:hypothetical protein
MAPVAIEKPYQDLRPATQFVCASQYNKQKVFNKAKPRLTYFRSSCDHMLLEFLNKYGM